MNGEFTTQADTNWFEVVSSEVRAWWEVLGNQQSRAGTPDPMYDQWRWSVLNAPGVYATGPDIVQGEGLPNGNGGISTPMLLLGAVVIALLLWKK